MLAVVSDSICAFIFTLMFIIVVALIFDDGRF